MRRLLPAILLAAAALLIPAGATASTAGTCTVDPPTISLSTTAEVVVTSQGGVPLEWYETQLWQGGKDASHDAHRVSLDLADETGTVVAVISVADGQFVEGAATFKVGPVQQRIRPGGGQGASDMLATCNALVMP
jgi:hypothetical protein